MATQKRATSYLPRGRQGGVVRFRDRKGEVVVRTDRIARQLNEAFGRQLGDLKRPELENRRWLVRQGDVFSVFVSGPSDLFSRRRACGVWQISYAYDLAARFHSCSERAGWAS